MGFISAEFIRDVRRVISADYVLNFLGSLATPSSNGLMPATDKVKVDALDTTYAPIFHDHDADYASLTHDHDGVYSVVAHNHDAAYSPIGHNHDTVYATVSHNHDSLYSAMGHNHDADYAALGHDHDADYAPVVHNHDDRYYTETEINTTLGGYAVKASTNTFTARQAISAASDSALLKLERTTTSAGLGYIGADSTNVLVSYDSGFAKRFAVTQSGHLSLPYLPVFGVTQSQSGVTGGTLIFTTVNANNGGHYSSTTGLFTAPVTGLYEFSAHTLINRASSSNAYGYIQFIINGSLVNPISHGVVSVGGSYETVAMNHIFALNAGNTIGVYVVGSSGGSSYGGPFCSFSGKLLTV